MRRISFRRRRCLLLLYSLAGFMSDRYSNNMERSQSQLSEEWIHRQQRGLLFTNEMNHQTYKVIISIYVFISVSYAFLESCIYSRFCAIKIKER